MCCEASIEDRLGDQVHWNASEEVDCHVDRMG